MPISEGISSWGGIQFRHIMYAVKPIMIMVNFGRLVYNQVITEIGI